jgi:sentrin-specific protease 1
MVRGQDLARLRPREWLNDEVINFYGVMVNNRSKEGVEVRKKKGWSGEGEVDGVQIKELKDVHVFSTFFWTTWDERGYEGVKRWTRKVGDFFLFIFRMRIFHDLWNRLICSRKM